MNRKVGLGVLTPPPSMLDTLDGRGGVRTPSPTRLWRFRGSRREKCFRGILPANLCVATGILPAVEGRHPDARDRYHSFLHVDFLDAISAGLEAPALRQAGCLPLRFRGATSAVRRLASRSADIPVRSSVELARGVRKIECDENKVSCCGQECPRSIAMVAILNL